MAHARLGWHHMTSIATPAGRVQRAEGLVEIARHAARFSTHPGPVVPIPIGEPVDALLSALGAIAANKAPALCDPGWPPKIFSALDQELFTSIPAANREPGDYLVTFTSGSTGHPKALLRSQESWIASFNALRGLGAPRRGDVVLAAGALSFSTTLYAAMEALYIGADLLLLDRFRAATALEFAAAERASHLYATPAQLALLAARGGCLPDLRRVICGGARLDPGLRARVQALFPQAAITEFFGAAEASFLAAHAGDAPQGSVGCAVPGCEIRIRDDTGHDLPRGTPGRIWVRGTMLFEHYLAGTAGEVRRVGDWLWFGETGHIDTAGNLYVAGREARMTTISDRNVYLEPVEAVLLDQPGVIACAVVAVPDALRGNVLLAAVQGGTEAALRKACRDALGAAATPRRIRQLDDWPLLPSGKTDYAAITRFLTGTE